LKLIDRLDQDWNPKKNSKQLKMW